MTQVCPSAPINHSISPIDSKDVPLVAKEVEEDIGKEDEGRIEEHPVPVPEANDGDEQRRPRVSRRPMTPTKAEIDEHLPLHLNYRSWCKHCVAGRARLAQHATAEVGKEKLGITWSADYAFMVAEEAEEGMQPTLIMYDDDKQSFWAIGVSQ